MSASSSPSLPPAKRARSKSPVHEEADAGPAGLVSQAGDAAAAGPSTNANGSARAKDDGGADKQHRKEEARRARNKRKDYQRTLSKSGREPIEFDIEELLGRRKVTDILSEGREFESKFPRDQEVELVIERLNSHGDGLAKNVDGDWVIAVPNTLPGERVVAQVTSNERMWSRAKLVKIIEGNSEKRRDDLVGCKYFGSCGGCQYQMLTYEEQLRIKQGVVERAFKHYSELDPSLVPEVLPTMPSPKQYNYRTKLTPHFNLPFELRRGRHGRHGDGVNAKAADQKFDFPIGFDSIGTKRVMDIEECPIATVTINRALPVEKQRVKDTIHTYKNGATILLRDSLKSYESVAEDTLVQLDAGEGIEPDTEVVTNHKATVKERVWKTKFESPAGTFFQNNRSILPSLLDYVREQIVASRSRNGEPAEAVAAHSYLVDAYCGSGLFSLCLASLFKEVSGVEISSESIKYAKKNADLNGIANAKFLAGNAEDIFGRIDYPPERTTVIIDPPRRGCDEAFIEQLVKLGPSDIVYVSCNVHTQARDVGQLLRKAPEYEILSVRGADLFPQTQ
ncbi:related to TRM2 - tRNA(m5U54)methyltransferase [Pseudozyma flocculosa]|uniref:Related to TRM2 - tRNA(M5U54)methyltransferase n=1 Tax=Pseudozyma flocculosa TaxID=84751 RepID=A0A5C3EX42_9BASI|nr:related to TRM2 - tRNA(m5U54)methyltransferase [Pseudozyma flocculosa]